MMSSQEQQSEVRLVLNQLLENVETEDRVQGQEKVSQDLIDVSCS